MLTLNGFMFWSPATRGELHADEMSPQLTHIIKSFTARPYSRSHLLIFTSPPQVLHFTHLNKSFTQSKLMTTKLTLSAESAAAPSPAAARRSCFRVVAEIDASSCSLASAFLAFSCNSAGCRIFVSMRTRPLPLALSHAGGAVRPTPAGSAAAMLGADDRPSSTLAAGAARRFVVLAMRLFFLFFPNLCTEWNFPARDADAHRSIVDRRIQEWRRRGPAKRAQRSQSRRHKPTSANHALRNGHVH